MGEARRKKLRGEYPVGKIPSIPPDPAYRGLLISLVSAVDHEDLGINILGISHIAPRNMILPTGRMQRSLFFHDGDTDRVACCCNGDNGDVGMLFTAMTGFPLVATYLLKAVSSSANELEDRFPGRPDNIVCFMVEAKVRDSATGIEEWSAVGIEYSLGSASHQQFLDLYGRRFEAMTIAQIRVCPVTQVVLQHQ